MKAVLSFVFLFLFFFNGGPGSAWQQRFYLLKQPEDVFQGAGFQIEKLEIDRE